MRKNRPQSGIYSNSSVYKSYEILFDALEDFIPEDSVSGSVENTRRKMIAKILGKCNNCYQKFYYYPESGRITRRNK